MQKKTVFFLCLSACLFVATGCSTIKSMFSNVTFGEEEQEVRAGTPETRLREAMEAYDTGKYTRAVKLFTSLLEEHPYSQEALLAELKVADAYYYDGKYDEAKKYYKEFEQKHPSNEAVPYVLFQYGMCDYTRLGRIDRDPASMMRAIDSFTRLRAVAPNSPFAEEAERKINDARDFLAHHEYAVAEFYKRTGKAHAAKQRLNYLISVYPESEVIPRARALLTELAGETASEEKQEEEDR